MVSHFITVGWHCNISGSTEYGVEEGAIIVVTLCYPLVLVCAAIISLL